ncbi:hypothetical protein BA895_12640 [Humibacillus sp. DSM 29435]|nr:hypothetical protein BA895_12640 [Humibacillus sp. DSM 29435]
MTLDVGRDQAHTRTMNTRERLSQRTTLAAVVATAVVALGALAASPAVAAPVTPVRATAFVSTASTTAALPVLPVLTPAREDATMRVARLGSCSAAMMDL